MADIVIAHAHRDRAFAASLAASLEQQGFSVFVDEPTGLQSGELYAYGLAREINAAGAVIVVWSALLSDVGNPNEAVVAYAERRAMGEKLVVIQLDGAELPPQLSTRSPLPFRSANMDHNQQSLIRLVEFLDFRLRDVRKSTGSAPEAPAAPPPPPMAEQAPPAPPKPEDAPVRSAFETIADVPETVAGLTRAAPGKGRPVALIASPDERFELLGGLRVARARRPARNALLEVGLFVASLAALAALSGAFGRGLLDWALGAAVVAGGGRRRKNDADTDRVHASLFAPRRLSGDRWAQVQVFLHLYKDRGEVRSDALEIDPDAAKRAGAALRARLPRGQLVTAQLVPLDGGADAFEIRAEDPSAVWEGDPTSIDFFVRAAGETPAGRYRFAAILYAGARALGELTFTLDVGAARLQTQAAARSGADIQVAEAAKAYEKVFFSYAREDVERVRLVARGYDMIDQSFFLDVENLKPGDKWEAELYRRIDESDLFILFWSEAARRSEMVRKEVEHALSGETKNGRPRFAPFPLDGPPPPKLWDTIRARHVGDRLYYRVVQNAERSARRAG